MAIGYINAGGRGTRLYSIFPPHADTGVAKALLEIGDPRTTLLEHHVANLRHQDIGQIVVATGDQGAVYTYAQDMYAGSPDIHITRSARQLGTGGDLVQYVRTTEPEAPLLIQNVDTVLALDLMDFVQSFKAQQKLGAIASIALTLNHHVPNEGAFRINQANRVVSSMEFHEECEQNQSYSYAASSTGAVIMQPDFIRSLSWREQDRQLSLYKDCLRTAWEHEGLYAYNNGHKFFRDVGTVAMWLLSQGDVELQYQLRYDLHTMIPERMKVVYEGSAMERAAAATSL